MSNFREADSTERVGDVNCIGRRGSYDCFVDRIDSGCNSFPDVSYHQLSFITGAFQ